MRNLLNIFTFSTHLLVSIPSLAQQKTAPQEIEPFQEKDYQLKFREYHSLDKPYIGARLSIPGWFISGSTKVTRTHILLTPDQRSKVGHLWNIYPNQSPSWIVKFEFMVDGSSPRSYADGFAFWYTKEKNVVGRVFGSKNYFTGLGVFLDTYNNNPSSSVLFPYLSSWINDGSISYEHSSDGPVNERSGCHLPVFGKKTLTELKISYVDRVLRVEHKNGDHDDYKLCVYEKDVELPTGYFFGFSAATGDVTAEHYILRVATYEVVSNKASPIPPLQKVKPGVIMLEPELESNIFLKILRHIWGLTKIIFLLGALLVACFLAIYVIRMKVQERNAARF
ncbi:vesicular integral-membrane protein VIP36-like isoform X2 [Zophobas morio]|uniref:vesicular integral-membrane protein VIP36-like isoform X2 n=1 Tax=Zophobas morio TaxID=2755281 RepID=UPI003082E5A2